MNATIILHRLRVFLLSIAALLCVGTVLELWLTEHTESAVQLIPFGLCGLGLLAIGAALLRPQRATLLILRLSMGLMAVGSAFGIFEHIEHNLAFELEIRPTATANQVFLDALSGASPLLAPVILALAAVLAIAATYYHPALEKR
jgi:hypothetical protein